MAKYLDETGLAKLWEKIKSKFISNVTEGTGITVSETTAPDGTVFRVKTISLDDATTTTIGGVKLTDTIDESDDVSSVTATTPKAVADAINQAIVDAGAATQVYAHVSGDSGTANASTNNDTITIAGGTGISTAATNGGADADTLTVNLDQATSSTIGGVKLTDTVSDSDLVESGIAVTPYAVDQAIKQIPNFGVISINGGIGTVAPLDNTDILNVLSDNGITISANGQSITIEGNDESAEQNGTTLSMVTTGDKYNWNQAASRTGFKVISDGTNSASADTAEDTLTVSPAANTAITVAASNTNDTLTIGLGAATSNNVGGIKSQTADSSDNTYKVNVNNNGLANVGIPTADESTDGIMSSEAYTKLDGIATGAEVNQNAFGIVKAGNNSRYADAKVDTLIFTGGTGITTAITNESNGNSTNDDSITISLNPANGTTLGGIKSPNNSYYDYDSTNGGKASVSVVDGSGCVIYPTATTTQGGLMSPSMVSDLNNLKDTVASTFQYVVPANGKLPSSIGWADPATRPDQRSTGPSDQYARMYTIYFVPIADIDQSDDEESNETVYGNNGRYQTYAEYILVQIGSGSGWEAYTWERLGTTDVNIDSITEPMINEICV